MSYTTDSPIENETDDRFHRWPFAVRLAETISSRSDPESLVIGLYGAWGEGKTSVLNFVRSSLQKDPNTICIYFNPWRCTDEEQLLKNFFQTLADTLDRELRTRTEKVGESLKKYAKILSPLSALGVDPSNAAEGLGAAMSEVDLEEIRGRIEKILDEEKKRIVIIMDDIDRLDKNEIYTVFRLVKLSADFRYTTYLLSFDEEMVSASLAGRYGAGDFAAGRSFLEKIIQVPLNLPKTDEETLRRLCFEGLDKIFNDNNIQIADSDSLEFVHLFTEGLQPLLNSPRMVKRYINGLSFAIPILKGEVNPTDQCLIEGIRIFLPKLYTYIKKNEALCLQGPKDQWQSASSEAIREHIKEQIPKHLNFDFIASLLKGLFPRLQKLFTNSEIGRGWEDSWSQKKKITSSHYFARYFSYGIPADDISDIEFEEVLDHIEQSNSGSEIEERLRKLITNQNNGVFLDKIFQKKSHISSQTSGKIAIAISRMGKIFPHQGGMFSQFTSPFYRATTLVGDLTLNIPAVDRKAILEEALTGDTSVDFASNCLIRSAASQVLQGTELSDVGKILSEKIKKTLNGTIVYADFPNDAGAILSVWRNYGSPPDVENYLQDIFDANKTNVLKFIAVFVGQVWGLTDGKSIKSGLSRTGFDNITSFVNPDIIIKYLKSIAPEEVQLAEYQTSRERTEEEALVGQYVAIFNQVSIEKQSGSHSP